MPKKDARGPFWFFMEDFRETLPASQRRVPRNILSELAKTTWSGMSESQKAKYREQADRYKLNPVYKEKEVRYTTDGRTFQQVKAAENEEKRKIDTIKKDIANRVRLAEIKNCLQDQIFYFMHVNYYCMVPDNMYYPCEMAISEYSIRSGITRTFHTFIDPGEIPIGYSAEVRKYSDEIHKVPYPPPETAMKDHFKLYSDIKKFLEKGRGEGEKIPPVYTYYGAENFHFNKQNEVVVESVLKNLCISAGANKDFIVYPLRRLFFELHNACIRSNPKLKRGEFKDDNVHYLLIEQDSCSHKPGLSCDVHEEKDASLFCSLSLVQRWSFPISFYCCSVLGIPVVPGKHCPADMRIECNPILGAEPTTVSEAAYVASRSTTAGKSTTDVAGQAAAQSAMNIPAPHLERQEVRKPYKESLATTYKGIPKDDMDPESDDFVARKRREPAMMRGIQMEKPLFVAGRGRGLPNISSLSIRD